MAEEQSPEKTDGLPVAIEGSDALRSGIMQVIGQAKLSLLIQSPRLDDRIYRNLELVETLKQQALEHRRLRVKILVCDAKNALREAEALIGLARRLSSQFEIREPSAPEQWFEDECVIADRLAYVQLSRPENLIATLALHDPLGTHTRRIGFDARWHMATPSMELRQLY